MPPLKQARKLTNRCPEHKETAPAGELKPQVIGLSSEPIRHDHSRFTSLQLRFINFRPISPVRWVAKGGLDDFALRAALRPNHRLRGDGT